MFAAAAALLAEVVAGREIEIVARLRPKRIPRSDPPPMLPQAHCVQTEGVTVAPVVNLASYSASRVA